MSAAVPADDSAIRWRIDAGGGAQPVDVVFQADAQLQAVPGDGGEQWLARGEKCAFRSPAPMLPTGSLEAGWYEFRCRLESSDGSVLLPSLYAGYEGQVDGGAQVQLPDVAGGELRVLVLLAWNVRQLRFFPCHRGGSFTASGFRLTRLSRPRALAEILLRRPSGGESPLAAMRRVAAFAADSVSRGVSAATIRQFEAYQRRLVPPLADDYEQWARRFDTLDEARLADLRRRAEVLGSDAPLISVVVPVYQTPEKWLRRCIESVLDQVYPRWQLCLVDDASPDARVFEVLQAYAAADERITVARRGTNGHISAASNSALELAAGDYVALLDHDDELRPHALLKMAEAIVERPERSLLYSDEDKLGLDGRRFDPYFKPDFDPDLLRGQNYLCHLTVIRTSLVREVGGFREGFEGSQDHDLVLRCTERLRPGQVHHVPAVLYHWRAIPGSTALSRDAKDYASSAGARAVADQLERTCRGAVASELSHGHYRVRWPLPSPPPLVSLVIPTRDRPELLRTCVESILSRTSYGDFELVVVDNGSTDADALDYLALLEGRDRVRVLRYDQPFNYSAINNWAVAQCRGEVLGLVNNDIEVISPDWLDEMVSHALRPEIGAVGAMLYYPDDSIQHAGVVLGIHGVAAHVYAGLPRGYPGHGGRARVVQRLSAVTGACLLVRRGLYDEVGGLDERLEVAFNDIDFCLRLREAGYHNLWTPFAELYHHESASRGHEDTEAKRQRFAREVDFMHARWGEALQGDPAYNPNLSLDSRYFELAAPPRTEADRWP